MDSKRLVTLKALTTQLQTITAANGYQHDIDPTSVYRGRIELSSDAVLPALTVLEAPKQELPVAPNEKAPVSKQPWELFITGWVHEDILNPTDAAHLLMADTKKCLSQVLDKSSAAYFLGGLIYGMNFDGGVCRPPDDHSKFAYFMLAVQLNFVECAQDPYDLT